MFYQPFLFGTIGANVLLGDATLSMFGGAIIIVLVGIVVRWLATFIITTREKKYTGRERAFMGIAWIPKASVVAALSGLLLTKAKEERLTEDYLQYGQAF